MAGRSVSRLVGGLDGWMFGNGWLIGQSVNQSVGWLVG